MKKLCYSAFFSEILPKFSNLVNFDDCIEKIKSNLSDYNNFLLKNIFQVKKKYYSSEKIRNSGKTCMYDYAHPLIQRRFLIQCAILTGK